MRVFKRFLSISLIVVMVCVLFPAIKVNAATKLNKTKATIYVGKTVKLKLSGAKDVTWSTSNKKVATVSKNGKVKGIKAGKAVITATAKGKDYKCTVKVKELKELEMYSEDFYICGNGMGLEYIGELFDDFEYYLDGQKIDVVIKEEVPPYKQIFFPEKTSEGPHVFTVKKAGYKPFSMPYDYTSPVFDGIWWDVGPYEIDRVLYVGLNPEIVGAAVVTYIDGKKVSPIEAPSIDKNGVYMFRYDITDYELGDHTVTVEVEGFEKEDKIFNKYY